MAATPAPPKIILDQVRRLVAIPADKAPEGLIFYCARMLDGMCADLVFKLGQKPSPNIFSNLMTVEALRLIDNIKKELAHTLRRMGNAVRHSLMDSSLDDTKLAVVLVREMLHWYEGLEKGEVFGEPIGRLDGEIDADWGVVTVVGLLSRIEAGDAEAIEALFERLDDVLSSRFLATLCAEALINCRRTDAAEDILKRCAATFGTDQRHQQLSALVLSRSGRLEEAVKAADQLMKNYSDDDETAGIAGGIYKRRWDRDESQGKALEKAHGLYFKQWERGKKINAYLGVNAASTAVYLGKLDKAREIASVVVQAMDKRDAALAAARLQPQDGGVAEYFDTVSRAEAQLVSGQYSVAYESYQAAFTKYAHFGGVIDVTRDQGMRVARTLGIHGFSL